MLIMLCCFVSYRFIYILYNMNIHIKIPVVFLFYSTKIIQERNSHDFGLDFFCVLFIFFMRKFSIQFAGLVAVKEHRVGRFEGAYYGRSTNARYFHSLLI